MFIDRAIGYYLKKYKMYCAATTDKLHYLFRKYHYISYI